MGPDLWRTSEGGTGMGGHKYSEMGKNQEAHGCRTGGYLKIQDGKDQAL